jgi:hypothetical protein
MEAEVSLPCSQQLSSDPYLELDQSSPYHPTRYFKIYFNIIHSPTSQAILVVSSFLTFPPMAYKNSSPPPFVLHTLPISSSFIWSL